MEQIDYAIAKFLNRCKAKPDYTRPPTPEEIAEAESTLGAPLPPDYVYFLQKVGAYNLQFWQTFPIASGASCERDIVSLNQELRQLDDPKLPEYLIAFHHTGCGDYLCFDTSRPDFRGECPIIYWSHEMSTEDNIKDPYEFAESFATHLIQDAEEPEAFDDEH